MWFTPDDDALYAHSAEAKPRMHLRERDRKVCAHFKLPLRLEADTAFREFEGAVTAALRIYPVVQVDGWCGSIR
jgi:hypothetical protein